MRFFATLLGVAALCGCEAGVLGDPREPGLQLVPSTPLSVQRAIALSVVPRGQVSDVLLLRDGQLISALQPPAYTYSWDAGQDAEGTYVFSAVAHSSHGTVSSNDISVVVDRTSPQVVSFLPSPGADPVPVSGGFKVVFSEPMLPASVSASAVVAQRDGAVIDARLALSADGRTLQISPATAVRGAYQIFLSEKLTDLAGNPLRLPQLPVSWQKVVARPGPVASLSVESGTNAVRLRWSPPDDGLSAVTEYRYVVRRTGNVDLTGRLSISDLGSPPHAVEFGAALRDSRTALDGRFGPLRPAVFVGMPPGAAMSIVISAVNVDGEGPPVGTKDVVLQFPENMRFGQSAVTLDSGGVLIVGGFNPCGPSVEDSCFGPLTIYDPATGTLLPAGSDEPVFAMFPSAVRLGDGRVLVAGGSFAGIGGVAARIYDPVASSFTNTGSLAFPQDGATPLLLGDGRVLLYSGGNSGSPGKAQIYQPDTGSFVAVGAFLAPSLGAVAAVTPSGRVLFAGMDDASLGPRKAVLFDPGPAGSQSFSVTDAGFSRDEHVSATATALLDGRVLVAGGSTAAADIYDPSQGTFTRVAPLLAARTGHTATLLDDGRVLFAGGTADGRNSVEIYDPAHGGVAAPGLKYPRAKHTANRISGNKLLVLGGESVAPGDCPDEVYSLP